MYQNIFGALKGAYYTMYQCQDMNKCFHSTAVLDNTDADSSGTAQDGDG